MPKLHRKRSILAKAESSYGSNPTPTGSANYIQVIDLNIDPSVSDTVEQNTSLPTLDHSLTVRVSVIVRGDVPDNVADPTVESLHSKVMADLTVNNLAIDVQPSDTSFELLDADQPVEL